MIGSVMINVKFWVIVKECFGNVCLTCNRAWGSLSLIILTGEPWVKKNPRGMGGMDSTPFLIFIV